MLQVDQLDERISIQTNKAEINKKVTFITWYSKQVHNKTNNDENSKI